MIGEKIQHYQITRLIGEGGMASVYEAVHQKLQSKVAIKVLNPILTANNNIRQRFENEARFMASLQHANITRVIDYEERNDLLAIIIEFLEGEDLNVRIKRDGALPLKEVISIFTQVLDAFQYAHGKSIVHRDVKPSNIFIEPSGIVKILDFGIAKLVGSAEDMTVTGTQIGTPVYMSPEQVNTDKNLDHRSDIYSLGVTLFYLLNGRPPYDTNTTSSFQIFTKIVYEPLPDLDKYPQVNKVLKTATNKDPNQRFQSCSEFKEALLEAIKEQSKPVVENNIISDDDRTLIDMPADIPHPVTPPAKKQVIEEKKQDKPAANQSKPIKPVKVDEQELFPTKKTSNVKSLIFSIIVAIAALVSISIKVYPGWIANLFYSEEREMARKAEANKLISWADAEFAKLPEDRNYDSAVYYMQKAVDLDENNAQAWSYLSDAIYHTATPDGLDLTNINYEKIAEASDAIEKVIKLNPDFFNQKHPVDPHARLTIFWGELAWHYLAEGDKDSAMIAYEEGKKRGGFTDILLEIARNSLKACDQNAIFFETFDLNFHPVMYLQQVENYRTDVSVVNMAFLRTGWYFDYIANKMSLPLSSGRNWFNSLKDKTWEAQQLSLSDDNGHNVTWWLGPDEKDNLTVVSQVMLDLVNTNKFKRPLCFSIASNNVLGLQTHLYPEGWLLKLKPDKPTYDLTNHELSITTMSFEAMKNTKVYSRELRAIIDYLRNSCYSLISNHIYENNKTKAISFRSFVTTNIPESNIPFYYNQVKFQAQNLTNELDYTLEQLREKEITDIQNYLEKNNLKGTKTSSGLIFIEQSKGSGQKPNQGSKVKINYCMTLFSGDTVGSSKKDGAPLEFELGSGTMIQGFNEGVALMNQGSKVKLIVPFDLGYGKTTLPNAPSYSTLVFDVELLDVK